MKKTLENINLDELYRRAEQSYRGCIVKDREMLEAEIQLPFAEVTVERRWVRVKFESNDDEHFAKEIRLNLLSPSKEILGYYCYYENEDDEYVDDFLVFE